MLHKKLKFYDSSFDQQAAVGNAIESILGPVPVGELWEVERIFVERTDAVVDAACFVRARVGASGATTGRTMDFANGIPAIADENSPIRLNEREQLTLRVSGLTGNPNVNVSIQFTVFAVKNEREARGVSSKHPVDYAMPQRTHVPAGAEWPGELS